MPKEPKEKQTSAAALAQQLLCPPGNGVFTIHTAKEKKAELHQQIFGETSPDKVEEAWKKSLAVISKTNDIPLMLAIPSDAGGGILRGANWGPLLLRGTFNQTYPDFSYQDLGDVRVIPHFLHDKYLNQATIDSSRQALYQSGQVDLPVSPLSICERFLHTLYRENPQAKVFGVGGDHSVSYPLVKAYLESRSQQKKNVAILHFDAHTDLLESRLGVDICFGSWAYPMLELLNSPDQLIQVGIRSTGKDRSHWQNTMGVRQYWAKEVRTSGIQMITSQIIEHLKSKAVDEVYISFDIDALDESLAGATGTPEPDGLFQHEAVILIQEIYKHFAVGGADIVEIAPFTRPHAGINPEPETTLLNASLITFWLMTALKGGEK